MPILRERILAEGIKGTSKSYQWLLMARWLKPRGVKFRVCDTDDAIQRMLETEFQDLIPEEGGNVYVYPVFDWPEYTKVKDVLMKESVEGDWNVIDMADNAWKAIQSYYVSEVFKKDIGDYFLEQRLKLREQADMVVTKKGKVKASKLDTLSGWIDWVVINKMYDDFMLPLIYRSKAHLYMTSSVSVVSKDDDSDVRELYGPLGVKPTGQKNLAHQVHTEFLFSRGDDINTWEITTVKDRGRRLFDKAPLISLPKQYFTVVAGWE